MLNCCVPIIPTTVDKNQDNEINKYIRTLTNLSKTSFYVRAAIRPFLNNLPNFQAQNVSCFHHYNPNLLESPFNKQHHAIFVSLQERAQ